MNFDSQSFKSLSPLLVCQMPHIEAEDFAG